MIYEGELRKTTRVWDRIAKRLSDFLISDFPNKTQQCSQPTH
jgi:hypothetical protein